MKKKWIWAVSLVIILCAALVTKHPAGAKGDGPSEEMIYAYLAESRMAENELSEAESDLERMYANLGGTGEGTLLYARESVLKYDFVGAGLLYDKLAAMGHDDLMADIDREILEKIRQGTITDIYTASAAMSQIKQAEADGVDPMEYGYSQEDRTALEKIANGTDDAARDLRDFLRKDVESLRSQYPQLVDFENALSAVYGIEELYQSYLENGYADSADVEAKLADFQKLNQSLSVAFHVSAIDEAYTQLLIMSGAHAELAEYADGSGSQYAMVAVGQLLIDRKISESDLPSGFITVNPDHLEKVGDQCETALDKLEKKMDAADFRAYEDKVDAVKKTASNLALTEVDKHIVPEDAPIQDRSSLSMGKSAVDYALGNTEKGDKYMKMSLDTAPYSRNPFYVNAMDSISSAYYETGDLNAVIDIGTSVVQAYQSSVPHAYTSIDGEDSHKKDEVESYNPWDFFAYATQETDAFQTSQLSAANLLAALYTTCVAKENAALNIGKIDVSKFPTISFNLTTSEPIKDLANPGLLINDCNIVITDYTVEEKKYDKAIIYAVCDKSGSMEGSTGRLQSAVRSLAGSLSEKEKMGLIGFSSDVEFDSGIVDNVSDLSDYISRLEANGGTNIASGTFAALSHLSGSEDTVNVVIVMTDGEDSSFGEDNLQRLREYASDGHTLVYTVGMGSSVNASYLQQIASAGNGKFVYSFSASELSAIYEFIHAQMENNYVVTFTAKDVQKNDRVLTCVNKDGYSVTKTYSLGREEQAEPVTEYPDFSCTGFVTKKIYKQNESVETSIRGTGFRSDMTCFVTLENEVYRGSFEGKYHNDKAFLVTLPAAVQPGKYKVVISIEGGTFTDEIEVLNSTEQLFTFGAYTFSCDKVTREEDRDEVVLSGNVVLNQWLHFDGDVIIKGDIKGEYVTFSAPGSFIAFDNPAPGLLSEFGDTVFLGSWTDWEIWKDKDHMTNLDEYKVDTRRYETKMQLMCIFGTGPELQLYPHKLQFKFFDVEFNFPFIKNIFDGGIPLRFSAEVGGFLDKKGLHSKGHLVLEDVNAKKKFFKLSLGIKKLALTWDTSKHDYGFTFIVNTDLLFWSANPLDGTNYGFEIGFKSGELDMLKLYADTPITVIAAPVPITMSNFQIAAEDLRVNVTGSRDNKPLKSILAEARWEGSADIGVGAVSEVIPSVKPIFGKLSLVTLTDTKIEFGLNQDWISLTSGTKLFGEIDFGKRDLTIGKFSFESYILNQSFQDAKGIYCYSSTGPEINLKRLQLKYQGALTWSITNQAALICATGDMDFTVDLWKKMSLSGNGNWELGVYGDGGSPNFYIGFKTNSGASYGEHKTQPKCLRIGLCGWKPYYKWE